MRPLTPREVQVAEKVTEDKPDKVIASELNITEHSVRYYLRQLFLKLNAKSRTGVVVAYINLLAGKCRE